MAAGSSDRRPAIAAESHLLQESAELDALYDSPSAEASRKEFDRLHPPSTAFVRASPFVVLATSGPQGLDASPRGDRPGFVEVADDRTLLLPDRRGNNRIGSLRNVLADPRVGLLFLIPGVGETLRVRGRAAISISADLLHRFVLDGEAPRTVLVVAVDAVSFQFSRSVVRSGLWTLDAQHGPADFPSRGEILDASRNTGGNAAGANRTDVAEDRP